MLHALSAITVRCRACGHRQVIHKATIHPQCKKCGALLNHRRGKYPVRPKPT